MPSQDKIAIAAPDSTAVRVALWRALHLEADAPPHVLNDSIGIQIAAPDPEWRNRPDMHAQATRGFRASIVSRARFIEDMVIEKSGNGLAQYVLLGAGLDTFAQRHAEIASRLSVFEIDKPSAQQWKRQRLIELGFGIPEWLHLVPVDFEKSESWLERLAEAGFDSKRSAFVASTGVSMYLTKEATAATLRDVAKLAPGSTFAMTFLLPTDLIQPEDRAGMQMSEKGARASGTPFVSFYTPAEIVEMARNAGFRHAEHVSGVDLGNRYFAGRSDGLRPSSGEDFLVAST